MLKRRKSNRTMKTELTEQQEAAVMSDQEWIVCIAGPGSGKTQVLASRVARLIAKGTNPKDIIVLTYTVQAASNIRRRISLVCETMRDAGQQLGYCGTLHGYCWSILQQPNIATGVGLKLPLSIVTEKIRDEMIKTAMDATRAKCTMDEARAAIARCPVVNKPMFRTPADTVAMSYYNTLLGAGMIDFDGILSFGLKAVGMVSHASNSHLLVDEVQDASEADYRIYRNIKTSHKFLVGDPDQSIYGFRGAKPELMFNAPFGTEKIIYGLELSDNFRSGSAICDAASILIRHNNTAWKKVIRSHRQSPSSVVVSQYDDDSQEMCGIEEWCDGHTTHGNKDSYAVLCRTNYQVQTIAEFLRASGVIVHEQARHATPRDWDRAMLYLAYMADPTNSVLKFETLKSINGRRRALSMMEIEQLPGKEEVVVENVASKALVALYRGVLGEPVSSESCDIIDAAVQALPKEATIQDLLVALRNHTPVDTQPHGLGIEVLTIHASKGREWDHVWLPGWCEERFDMSTPDSIEEERRVAFVGITRARNSVNVSWSKRSRLNQWQTDPVDTATPVSFIAEMDVKPVNTVNRCKLA